MSYVAYLDIVDDHSFKIDMPRKEAANRFIRLVIPQSRRVLLSKSERRIVWKMASSAYPAAKKILEHQFPKVQDNTLGFEPYFDVMMQGWQHRFRQLASPSVASSSPYDSLFLKSDAPMALVESAYKTLSKLYHPDSEDGGDPDRMKEINLAVQQIRSEQDGKQAQEERAHPYPE